jgi:hypothetical protein
LYTIGTHPGVDFEIPDFFECQEPFECGIFEEHNLTIEGKPMISERCQNQSNLKGGASTFKLTGFVKSKFMVIITLFVIIINTNL